MSPFALDRHCHHHHHTPLPFLYMPKCLSTTLSPPPTPKPPPKSPLSITQMIDILHTFLYTHTFDHGSLEIHLMDDKDIEPAIELLSQSFLESLRMHDRYKDMVDYCVREYLKERSSLLPHATMLVGFYKERGEDSKEVFAGTAEVSFNEEGAGGPLPTPEPPRECPYICNMAVKKDLRRKGIGWHLLKACEKLVNEMSESKTVYLHCRLVDKGALSLYRKAGYQVYKTDSKLLWFVLQRRKHLLRKDLSLAEPPVIHYHSRL